MGSLTVGVSILCMWWLNPKNFDLMLAQIGRLFSFVGTSAKKIKVKREIQGHLNQQIKELDSQTEGLAPGGISVEWVKSGTQRDSFLLRGQVVLPYELHGPPPPELPECGGTLG